MNRSINRNAFIADLIELNIELKELNDVHSDIMSDESIRAEAIHKHLGISATFIAERFNDKEIENMVKMFCPTHYEEVLSILGKIT